jgi:hypothetical protein
MMNANQLAELASQAAGRAARDNNEPLSPWPQSLKLDLQRLPFLGSYKPKGWRRVQGMTWFVDMSGFGEPGEPALTFDAFVAEIEQFLADHAGNGRVYGFAFTELGQFQGYVQAYSRKVLP